MTTEECYQCGEPVLTQNVCYDCSVPCNECHDEPCDPAIGICDNCRGE